MCQSRAQGGRRCSYHMGASRALRALAAHASGLTPTQVTSLFNRLKEVGANEPAPTRQRFEQWLNRQTVLLNNSDLDGRSGAAARRALMMAREENLPDGRTFYALRRLIAESRQASRNLRREITEVGRRAGMNRNEARAFFQSHYENPPAEYQGMGEHLQVAGVPRDAATVAAYEALRRAADVHESNGARIELTRRIQREPVSVNSPLTEIGYDPEDGRLEVVMQAEEDSAAGYPERAVYAYRNVPPETWERLRASQRPLRTLNAHVRNNSDYLYENQAQAEDDAHRRRCSTCGRFRAMSHTCATSQANDSAPEPAAQTSTQQETASPEGVDVTVPDWRRRLARAWAQEPEERTETDMTSRPLTSARLNSNTHRLITASHDVLSQIRLESVSADYAVRAAVNRGELVRANVVYTSGTRTVNAEVETWRTEEGWHARVRERRCNCAQYERNGHCSHVDHIDREPGVIIRAAADPEQWEEELRVARARTDDTRIVTLSSGANRAMNSSRFLGVEGIPEDVTGVSHRNDDIIEAPRATDLRAAMNFGSVRCELSWRRRGGFYTGIGAFTVSGNVTMRRGMDGGVEVTERNLRCTCPQYRQNYHCVHVDYVGNQASRLAAYGNNTAPAVIGQVHTIAERERQADAANVERRERMRALFEAVPEEERYANNFAALQVDMGTARGRFRENPETAVPFMTENATGGICSPDGGRAFGVEIEFDFPPALSYAERAEALHEIGQDLYAAGLTHSSRQNEYHHAAATGYEAWSFEEDCTVDGEIVSPIMYDTPEHWEQLRQVCDIVKRHGGIASERTGSHVHVSTGSYGRSVDRHAELSRMTSQYEDILYRVSTNPFRGQHRPSEWCAPYEVTDRYIERARNSGVVADYFGSSHAYGINYAASGTGNPSRDNVEFRQWDGTLNPGIIQAQVKVSAAMVDAAERNVEVHGLSPADREPFGINANNGTRDDQQGTARFRDMLDTLFYRREDKQQIASLFAITSWQEDDMW